MHTLYLVLLPSTKSAVSIVQIQMPNCLEKGELPQNSPNTLSLRHSCVDVFQHGNVRLAERATLMKLNSAVRSCTGSYRRVTANLTDCEDPCTSLSDLLHFFTDAAHKHVFRRTCTQYVVTMSLTRQCPSAWRRTPGETGCPL